MFNIFTKIIFWLQKPAIIVVFGQGRHTAANAILQALEHSNEKLMVLPVGLEDNCEISKILFFIKNSSFPIVLITNFAKPKDEKDSSGGAAEAASVIARFLENLPVGGRLIFNFDDEASRQLTKSTKVQSISFGFQEGADLRATDIFITESQSPGTNFKMNYEGKIVPFWLTNLFGEEYVYAALAAAAAGLTKGLNLVAISQALINYKEDKMPG